MTLAKWTTAAGTWLLAALMAIPAWSAEVGSNQRTAMPGTLNYVEGEASMNGEGLNAKSVGVADLQNGEVLETGNGKAEILLTPGVYLRLGSNSSVKMISTNLTNTQVALNRGEAMIEADELFQQNDLQVSQPGADTHVLRTGLYDFDADHQAIRVFDGKADVRADDHDIKVKKNHELELSSAKLKARGFQKDQIAKNDDLYRWSSLRSEYLSEANVDEAQRYYANGWYGPGWWGPGWYWDPWFSGFTFLPGSGFFYNPFGWGFYSPLMVWRAPYYGGIYGYHHFDGARPVAIGRGFHNHAVTAFHGGYGHIGAPVHAGGFGGMHGGGGFHGGGGVHR